MHLDSARELKRHVRRTLVAPLAAPRTAPRLVSLAAQPIETAAGPHRTIALGIAPGGGRHDYRLAVRIQRRALEQGAPVSRIHALARGEVDVRYVGRVVKRATPWYQRRNRPLRIGGSIGHYRVTAGTLGAFARARGSGETLILSNNHVLADEDRGRKGDAILQPGAYDHGRRPADVVGALLRALRLKRRGANRLDCALASVEDPIRTDPHLLRGLGSLAGVGPPLAAERAPAAKVGRTTGVTHGRVTAFELDGLMIGYDVGTLRFDDQIEIEGAGAGPFSDGGDSGSLIVDADLHAIGLLFAGSDQGGANGQGLTYANSIGAVLAALKVELLY
jgi:hypothetical protein